MLIERLIRHRWYMKMLRHLEGTYIGLSLAEAVGLSESGKMQVARFDKWMRWIKNSRDGVRFTDE